MLTYHTLSDLELAALMQEDNHRAFAELYERYFGLLYLHAFHRLKDKDEARDLVQELFSNLWIRRAKLRPQTNFSNYMYSWIRNSVLNVIAHKKVEDKYLANLPDWFNITTKDTEFLVREHQLAAIIEEELQTLPPRMREVFELSRKNHLTYREIAERLELSEQSVRSHVKNALRILRVKLGAFNYLLFILK